MRLHLLVRALLLALFLTPAMVAQAADEPAERTRLPQQHAYQRALRSYLATLTENDFAHGVSEPLTVSDEALTAEEQYRLYVMTMMHQPLVGWKRGTPAINAPAWLFLLSTIEGPLPPPEDETEKVEEQPKPADPNDFTPVPIRTPHGIVVPPVWPETLMAFTQWDYAGNPYYNNRALKLRAFVTAVVKMVMLDDYFEKTPEARRGDFNGYKLACFGSTYLGAKEILPPEVQQAFEAGLLKLGQDMLSWGIQGLEPQKDMTVPVGLWYVAQACGQSTPETKKFAADAEAFARTLMTDPRYFHPAGYWVERQGGPDVGFGGGANFYAIWLALMTDWPFAHENVEKSFRLRAHLCLPDPDGFVNGPSHFNSRLGSPASADQWHWDGARDQAGFMLTDEAGCFIKRPSAEDLAGAAANRVGWFNSQIKQNPVRPDLQGRKSAVRTGYWANEDLRGVTWTWRLWQTYNFPIGINVGYDFYKPGSYAHLQKLEAANSPMLRYPYLREEPFVRNFADAFIAARQPGYGAVLHTGPIGGTVPAEGMPEYPGPQGFGGGQLSAFWTPETGSVILGRRIATRADSNYDTLETWRLWPIHAVSGTTASGQVFTSARIVQPKVNVQENEVTVSELIPAVTFAGGKPLSGKLAYQRKFIMRPQAIEIQTTVKSDGTEKLTELYETLPVFLRDAKRQAMAEPTSIEFEVDGKWMPGTVEFAEAVSRVRLKRFDGAVLITFDRPRRVKLSAEDWQDTYLTRGVCRNVMIDLLDDSSENGNFRSAQVGYRLEAAPRP